MPSLDDYSNQAFNYHRDPAYDHSSSSLIPPWLVIIGFLFLIFIIAIVANTILSPVFNAFDNVIPSWTGISLSNVWASSLAWVDYGLVIAFFAAIGYMCYCDYPRPSRENAVKYFGIMLFLGWFYAQGISVVNYFLPYYTGDMQFFYSLLYSGFIIFALYVALAIGVIINLRTPYGFPRR